MIIKKIFFITFFVLGSAFSVTEQQHKRTVRKHKSVKLVAKITALPIIKAKAKKKVTPPPAPTLRSHPVDEKTVPDFTL